MTQKSPKPTLVDDQGQIDTGLFDDSVTTVNGRNYDYRTPLGKFASRRAKHFHYKQFQYFGLVSEELLIGCALADTAYLGIAFVYLFDTRTGTLEEHTWRSPLAQALTLSDSPLDGESRFRQRQVDIVMGYQQNPDGTRRKSLEVITPNLHLNATMHEPAHYQPMSLCTRTGVNGWTYANKVAGVDATGTLQQHGRTLDFGALTAASGHHDFSAGYMRRETFWNWACLSGQVQGQRLGLNLSCGVNETSVNENCVWLDGRRIKVDGTAFEYHRDDLSQPWQVVSRCGQVALNFTPLGCHRERLNLGVFASNFQQLFGRFEGEIRPSGEAPLVITGLYGFVEEQYAKW